MLKGGTFEDFTNKKGITTQIYLVVFSGGTFDSKSLFKGGTFNSNVSGGTIQDITPKQSEIATFATKVRISPVKCAPSNSSVPPPMGAVGGRLKNQVRFPG